MRKATIIALFAVMLAGMAFAGNSGNGCKLEGTWYGEDFFMGSFNVQFHGEGNSTGALHMEITKFNDVFHQLWPDLTGVSHLLGNWKQTGGNSYSFVRQQTWYISGVAVGFSRVYGTMRFTDCNTLESRYTYFENFTMDMDLIEAFPLDPEAYPPGVAHRLLFID